MSNTVIQKRKRIQVRVRTRLKANKGLLRLSVFRSGKYIYAQAIDDAKGITIAQANDRDTKKDKKMKIDSAKEVGKNIAMKLAEKKVKQVLFDRGGFKYAGRVRAVCEAIRENGITI